MQLRSAADYIGSMYRFLGITFVLILVTPQLASAVDFVDKKFQVAVTTDVVYTSMTLDSGATADLTLDVYKPVNAIGTKPAIVICHGGGFAIFNKSSDATLFLGNPINSSITDYAMEFAKRGYVCVSINYPKIFDYPLGGGLFDFPVRTNYFPNTLGLSAAEQSTIAAAINTFLTILPGPPPSQPEINILSTIEGAFQAAVDAVNWVADPVNNLDVDPSRIAIGGWSAGASIAFNAKQAGANVAAVWQNSGGSETFSAAIVDANTPPTIAFHGDSDTIVAVAAGRAMRDELVNDGIAHEYYEMVGEDHFYFINRTVTESPSRGVPDTIENLIQDFFFVQMNLAGLSLAALPATGTYGMALLALCLVLAGIVAFGRRRRPE